MRTNGGCRCFEKAGFGPSAVSAALQMLPEITHLRAEVEKLRRVRDAVAEYRKNYDATGALLTNVLSHPTRKAMFAALDAAKSS